MLTLKKPKRASLYRGGELPGELWRTFAQGAACGILCLQPDGGLQYANRAVAELLDYPTVADLIDGVARHDLFRSRGALRGLFAAEEGGAIDPQRVELKRRDGSCLPVRLSGGVSRDQVSGVPLVIVLVEERSEVQAMSEVLRLCRRRLETRESQIHRANNCLTVLTWTCSRLCRLGGDHPELLALAEEMKVAISEAVGTLRARGRAARARGAERERGEPGG